MRLLVRLVWPTPTARARRSTLFCKPGLTANAPYYAYALREMARSQWIQALAKGIRERSTDFRFEGFGSQPVPLPPLPEQAAIVRYLGHADRRIQRYIRAKQKLVTLLEEQKQAIIRRAVTGQIDVRTGQPYPAYKPSGVEWLGDVPEHWEVRRLKTVCSMKSGDGITAMSIEPAGEYPVYGGNGLRGYTSSYTHDGNFALIGRQGALCGNVHIAQGRFWASEHAVVATVHSGHVLEWFGAILGVMHLNQYSIAAAQPGLSVERVLNFWLPVPPSEEQAVITTSIEQQTAGADIAIDRARRQIELLREFRTRLIADVVTGKLDVREVASVAGVATDAIWASASRPKAWALTASLRRSSSESLRCLPRSPARSIDNELITPLPASAKDVGPIVSRERLGGILNYYCRAA